MEIAIALHRQVRAQRDIVQRDIGVARHSNLCTTRRANVSVGNTSANQQRRRTDSQPPIIQRHRTAQRIAATAIEHQIKLAGSRRNGRFKTDPGQRIERQHRITPQRFLDRASHPDTAVRCGEGRTGSCIERVLNRGCRCRIDHYIRRVNQPLPALAFGGRGVDVRARDVDHLCRRVDEAAVATIGTAACAQAAADLRGVGGAQQDASAITEHGRVGIDAAAALDRARQDGDISGDDLAEVDGLIERGVNLYGDFGIAGVDQIDGFAGCQHDVAIRCNQDAAVVDGRCDQVNLAAVDAADGALVGDLAGTGLLPEAQCAGQEIGIR
ncbi:hypothetical protein IMCC9480_3265 [Oxalobacteraceae bacterium IMCC9480]|nr:hypothetical protein IMCC9480_3265 [Oxalobacteraceae bacterium IMCC9480]